MCSYCHSVLDEDVICRALEGKSLIYLIDGFFFLPSPTSSVHYQRIAECAKIYDFPEFSNSNDKHLLSKIMEKILFLVPGRSIIWQYCSLELYFLLTRRFNLSASKWPLERGWNIFQQKYKFKWTMLSYQLVLPRYIEYLLYKKPYK